MTMTNNSFAELQLNEMEDRDFQALWHSLDGPVFLVLDEEGHNVADARLKYNSDRTYYLYSDTEEGWSVVQVGSDDDVLTRAILVQES